MRSTWGLSSVTNGHSLLLCTLRDDDRKTAITSPFDGFDILSPPLQVPEKIFVFSSVKGRRRKEHFSVSVVKCTVTTRFDISVCQMPRLRTKAELFAVALCIKIADTLLNV